MVQRDYVDTVGKNAKKIGVHPEPTGGADGGPDITEGVHGPVYE